MTDMLAALCAETEVCCENCKRTAWISSAERFARRWTCFGCGLVNTWQPPAAAAPPKKAGRRVIPCCMEGCGKPKWRETDPVNRPGQYQRVLLRGWCRCKDE